MSEDGFAAAGAWLEAQADRVIDTHIARVFLVGEHAYKMKKAVDLGYLDFSTLQKREAILRRELELNRATAPDLYLSVRRITREADGHLVFDGQGTILEFCLQMRRFDPDAVLSNQPHRVRGDFAEALGRQVARFHAAAPKADASALEAMRFVTASNAEHLRALEAVRGDRAEALIEATAREIDGLAPLLEARQRQGFVRRCHGDLHLGNIFVRPDGMPVLFDCIEFNDRLAEIDVLYDLAFLVMDLEFRGENGGACRVLSGYLDEALRSEAFDLLAGMEALPLFLSMRAAIRGHVSAQMGQDQLARRYRDAALEHLTPPPPVLAAVGGLSGTGKSTVARALAPRIGAVVLRSDEIRKRLWGRAPSERLPAEAYALGQSERVYGQMLEEADALLSARRAVVLDAVFLREGERTAASELADRRGVPFAGAWLDAPPDILRRRVAGRIGDASDADVAVLETQLAQEPGHMTWPVLDAAGAAETTAESLLKRLRMNARP